MNQKTTPQKPEYHIKIIKNHLMNPKNNTVKTKILHKNNQKLQLGTQQNTRMSQNSHKK